VTLTPDGPFRLDGRFTLREVDAVGERDGGDALCRCGASASKPFCDGSHAAVDFSTAGEE
jgi:CDGSH-type Zn-finger protein